MPRPRPAPSGAESVGRFALLKFHVLNLQRGPVEEAHVDPRGLEANRLRQCISQREKANRCAPGARIGSARRQGRKYPSRHREGPWARRRHAGKLRSGSGYRIGRGAEDAHISACGSPAPGDGHILRPWDIAQGILVGPYRRIAGNRERGSEGPHGGAARSVVQRVRARRQIVRRRRRQSGKSGNAAAEQTVTGGFVSKSPTRGPPGELFGAKGPGDVERGASVQRWRSRGNRIIHTTRKEGVQEVIEFEGCYSARQGRERPGEPAKAAPVHRGD